MVALSLTYGCVSLPTDRYTYIPEDDAGTKIEYREGQASLESKRIGSLVSMKHYSMAFQDRKAEANFGLFVYNLGADTFIFSISDITATFNDEEGRMVPLSLYAPDSLRNLYEYGQNNFRFISKDTVHPGKGIDGMFAIKEWNELGSGILKFSIKAGNEHHHLKWRVEKK